MGVDNKEKSHRLELVELKGWKWFSCLSSAYKSFVRIDGNGICCKEDREGLSYEELLQVWGYAVKNENKLERLYLEKLHETLKFKREFERTFKKIKKGLAKNKNG